MNIFEFLGYIFRRSHDEGVLLSLLSILITKSVATIGGGDPSAQEIAEAFRLYMIVPQIIPIAPSSLISKLYNNKYKAYLGNEIPPFTTRVLPFTTFPNTDPNSLYVIIGIDPDYPQFFYTDGSQFLFELICNIPGANFAGGDLLSPLVPISPVPNSGEHRFIYLIYKQRARINVTTELLISISTNFYQFNITSFVEKFNLGNPVAGNFFTSEQRVYEPPPCIPRADCNYNRGQSDGYLYSNKRYE